MGPESSRGPVPRRPVELMRNFGNKTKVRNGAHAKSKEGIGRGGAVGSERGDRAPAQAPGERRCALNERDGGRGAFQGMGEECGQRINYTIVHSSGQG